MDETNLLLSDILRELKRINSGATSSVKITLQRGTVDIAVHAYNGDDVTEPEMEALASYRRIIESLNEGGVRAFEQTLKAVEASRS